VTRRRANVRQVHPGVIELSEREAHHLRDVLRMKLGDVIELFDDAGAVADAQIVECDQQRVAVRVDALQAGGTDPTSVPIVVASAVPKGDRAEWMIEKLSELGVSRFIPLATARSVVLPEGRNKRDRWTRIATEAAKQSRRSGVMTIDALTALDDLLRTVEPRSAFILSTGADARGLADVLQSSMLHARSSISLLVGPEGGWTDDELARCAAAGLTSAKLTATILRVETAAVAAAAVAASMAR